MIEEPSERDLEQALRTAWVAYAETTRRLLRHLDVEGLEIARRDLRPGGIWGPANVPAGWDEQRVLLLNDVASRLAAARGPGFEDYYRGAGDILAAAPDDASELLGDS